MVDQWVAELPLSINVLGWISGMCVTCTSKSTILVSKRLLKVSRKPEPLCRPLNCQLFGLIMYVALDKNGKMK